MHRDVNLEEANREKERNEIRRAKNVRGYERMMAFVNEKESMYFRKHTERLNRKEIYLNVFKVSE